MTSLQWLTAALGTAFGLAAQGLMLPCVSSVAAAPPMFQALMSPDCLPEPQQAMRVESAELTDGRLRIVTTGAELTLDVAAGSAVFRQRIGHAREVMRLRIEGGLKGEARLLHAGPGFAVARFAEASLDLRANGDSLFMLHARKPLRLTATRAIDPGFSASYRANHIVLDERGGFGLYCSVQDLDDRFDPFEPTTAEYDLPADAVLWVAVCPPRPYDWRRSVTDQVVWHWSNERGYPPDEVLAGWARVGNIVLLQSEVMLWKDWNLGFEPRLGPAEFARVRDTVHRHGMRFIVYTSPYYFLRGTALESAAMNSFEDFRNWPPGTSTGENMDLFLAEIARVMRELRPDGLYFDGQYTENPAALYLLARRARAIVGEDGILEWHSTNALGPDLCSLPPADAYVDLILRGEGRDALYGDDAYLRYFVSGYNVHNRIGVLCNNGGRPTRDLVRRLLAVNGRMHTLAGWLGDPGLQPVLDEYRAGLADAAALRARVDQGVEARQSRVGAEVAARLIERRELSNPPAWGAPILSDGFRSLEGWRTVVSPRNPEPFALTNDGLRITARASAFAYLEKPLDRRVRGFVVRIRRGTDGGASWGPAAAIEWPGGRFLRVGLRNDGLIQADISGDQRLAGRAAPDQWVWLRARWGERSGVIERSGDGKTFVRLWRFEHGGAFAANTRRIAVGKVPYNLQPADYSEPGDTGVCDISALEIH